MHDVSRFASENGLEEATDMLQRGALVAQNPSGFESLKELTDEEKEHLRVELSHKWKHPRALYMTIIICSIGAAVQGWDQARHPSEWCWRRGVDGGADRPPRRRPAPTAQISASPRISASAMARILPTQTTTGTTGLWAWSMLRLTSVPLSCAWSR